jgi:hypothetical protein
MKFRLTKRVSLFQMMRRAEKPNSKIFFIELMKEFTHVTEPLVFMESWRLLYYIILKRILIK